MPMNAANSVVVIRSQWRGKTHDKLHFSERNLEHLETHGAHGDFDLGLLADLLAEESLTDGTGGENLVVVVIFVAGSHEDEDFLLVEIEVLHLDAGAKNDGVAGQ